MIDTSVLVAGLVDNHEFHEIARPHVATAVQQRVPGIVVAETWALLRRAPFNLDASTVAQVLGPFTAQDRLLETPVSAYVQAMHSGPRLHLGGNIRDLLIAITCMQHELPVVTLDRRQAGIARTLPGCDVRLLLDD